MLPAIPPQTQEIPRIRRDTTDRLDYSLDWLWWLTAPEVISTATWTVPTGLTTVSTVLASPVTTIWLSGGSLGAVYTIKCLPNQQHAVP
jgi:hypothetical protein